MSGSVTFISTPATGYLAVRSDVGRRYIRAAVHSGIGGVTSRILQGFAPIILARYLGPKEYGVYALVLSLVGIVAGVSHLGQNVALQKFLPEYALKDPRRGGAILADTVILVSGALAGVCAGFYFLSGWIATAIYHDASLTRVFQFSALLVLALSLFNLASSAVAGLQDFKAYSFAMIVRGAAFLGLGWLGVWLLGLYGALLGQVLASFFGLVLLTVPALKMIHTRFPGAVRPAFSASILKEIFNFALPALLAGLLVSPAYWWANTLLARRAGFEQVGLFGVAFALAQLIMLVPSNLSIPAVSFMSEVYASRDHERFSTLVSTNLRLVWALALPIAAGCALISPLLIRLLFGNPFLSAVPLAAIMSFSALFIVINSVIGYAIAASGQMWHGFTINLFWLTVFMCFANALIPRMAASGLAVTFAASYMTFTVAVFLYSRWFMGVRFKKLLALVLLTVLGFAATALVLVTSSAWSSFAAALIVLPLIVLGELKWALAEGECASLFRSCPASLRNRYG